MHHNYRNSCLKGLAILATTTFSGWMFAQAIPLTQAAEQASAERAKSLVSQTTGRAVGQLRIANEAFLPDTDIRRFKVLDQQGNTHGVDLDSLGNPVSSDVMEQAVDEINRRGFSGKFENELAQRMASRAAQAGPVAPTNVVFWLKGVNQAAARGQDQTQEQRAAQVAAVRAQMATVQSPVVNTLRQRGQQVIYQAHYAPLVVAKADDRTIRAMAARDDVERVYLERVHKPRLNISRVVVQASVVEARGINGTGVRVGVVEPGRIANHPNLPGVQRILCRPAASAVISGHKTNVAGVIQSTNAITRGMAPLITIVDGIGANFSDAQMMAATDCVIAQGATAVNMSFGTETNGFFNAFARYVDATSYNTGRTIVVAVSNACANRMGSPEIAFNALAVGSFSDRNTVPFAGDVHSCDPVIPVSQRHSAFLDPFSTNGDREEPDVVAPGHLINTTNTANGFSNANGTSFAAPHVTGGVGLLQDRTPVFNTQGERARAIIMASARHNIEGASRLSERDGTGAVMLAAADRVLLNGQSWWFSKPGGVTGFPHNQTFFASAGQRVRVVVVWAHKMPLGAASTQPTTDLDLSVLQPGGVAVGTSASFDNSYEIVEFTAPVSGTYTARINNFRSSAGTEFIGLAVSRSDS